MREFELIERSPTVQEYLLLRRSAGWGEMSEGVALGLAHALYSVVLERDGVAVGCGRVVGDGGMYFYVQDVIVSPELRGRGFGARIMDRVMGFLEGAAEPGAFVGLMAAQGVEGFYERYGFRRRQDDRPGMFIVWDR
ncbi:MAG: GNAT family N-acetyltransferase [Actinomycetota bacterium]